ncbi:hypothetical protein [Ideonella sp.]|uniref:hypothetical protein n=1 Tax=Ideonella sp. TaxID=1929293 RepID=UPI003BB7AF73
MSTGDTLQDVDRKRIATATARAALVGAVLVQSTADNERPLLVLTKWAMCRAFTVEELPALERVLDSMGAAK